MIHHGLELAAEAQLLFTVNWEERMGQNLDELRRKLGIQPVIEGPWSWYSHRATLPRPPFKSVGGRPGECRGTVHSMHLTLFKSQANRLLVCANTPTTCTTPFW